MINRMYFAFTYLICFSPNYKKKKDSKWSEDMKIIFKYVLHYIKVNKICMYL